MEGKTRIRFIAKNDGLEMLIIKNKCLDSVDKTETLNSSGEWVSISNKQEVFYRCTELDLKVFEEVVNLLKVPKKDDSRLSLIDFRASEKED